MNEIEQIVDLFESEILTNGLRKIHGEIVDKLIERGDLQAEELCEAIHCMENASELDDDDYYASRLEDGYIFELSNGESYNWICDGDEDHDDEIEDDLYMIIEDNYADFLEKNNIEIEEHDYPNYILNVAIQTNPETNEKEEIELLDLVKMIRDI